jgi:hypothetical protein
MESLRRPLFRSLFVADLLSDIGTFMQGVGAASAFLVCGLATISTIALGAIARLPDSTADTTPWNHWRMPVIVPEAAGALDHAPVLVSVRYRVRPQHEERSWERWSSTAGSDAWMVRHGGPCSGIWSMRTLFSRRFWSPPGPNMNASMSVSPGGDRDVVNQVRMHIEAEPLIEHFIQAEPIS